MDKEIYEIILKTLEEKISYLEFEKTTETSMMNTYKRKLKNGEYSKKDIDGVKSTIQYQEDKLNKIEIELQNNIKARDYIKLNYISELTKDC